MRLNPITDDLLADPLFHDLTGALLCGGGKVIGLSAVRRGWLIQCKCGGFFTRKAKTVVNLSIVDSVVDGADRCNRCYQEFVAWRRSRFNETGEFPTRDEEYAYCYVAR